MGVHLHYTLEKVRIIRMICFVTTSERKKG